MNSNGLTDFQGLERQLSRPALGRTLRNDVYAKLGVILSNSDKIQDSDSRLLIQAACLDAISALEDLIQTFGLDETVQ